jgi:hypothetical protein
MVSIYTYACMFNLQNYSRIYMKTGIIDLYRDLPAAVFALFFTLANLQESNCIFLKTYVLHNKHILLQWL